MSHSLSMAAFALATSITPGPVNLIALGAGARYGLRASLRHVTGATAGFVLLLLLIGLGLHELLTRWPLLTHAIQWAGVAFLLYVAYRLAADDGQLADAGGDNGPSMLVGATMQWLNPKAWLASIAGMGAFATSGERVLVWQFAAIYFVVCFASIACWAWAGASLRHVLREPARVRCVNRAMALLLAASGVYLLVA
ncbi:LysE family translocator [Paraburkholderia caballeronis]|uniref:Threonine/homoserine/homoserine lactone efflux protein n=1 Tax=Paraburkholderia caballeronis TaxID=416943 RepID=A0A1H7VLT9_9BURK|nr:LysE family translocator [Paraburkholderia caballeronis]PXW14981.1 threonine/homoserine/homoserine lactone efflux protein [Paraburkholderia caballeronis]PXW93614.1 threonine/homoserine/homoserine lactone efflux protein [Paraburkholderia caballeronis]RAJ88945.1 threonine/homoserine/homoserine lactone efflux protein [Paraburkholderia caballeronis]SED95361.1 Threonine/homoserine/homoserine lactone efflux protein [Paraburkholderia caballeronis]SEM10262.1 Threonine/homoserine/homoserine lactone 